MREILKSCALMHCNRAANMDVPRRYRAIFSDNAWRYTRMYPRLIVQIMNSELTKLRDSVRQFAAERDWDQFHSPKNLAMALSVEAAELMEHFQWLTEEQSRVLPDEKKNEVRHELADVLIYLIRLADKLDIDLDEAAKEKLVLNAKKYPIDKAKGSMKKYTEL